MRAVIIRRAGDPPFKIPPPPFPWLLLIVQLIGFACGALILAVLLYLGIGR